MLTCLRNHISYLRFRLRFRTWLQHAYMLMRCAGDTTVHAMECDGSTQSDGTTGHEDTFLLVQKLQKGLQDTMF